MKIVLEIDTERNDITPAMRLLQGLLPDPKVQPSTSVSFTQEQVLETLRGATAPMLSVELQSQFPGLGVQNLAAYLAHLTRRGLVTRTPQGYLASTPVTP